MTESLYRHDRRKRLGSAHSAGERSSSAGIENRNLRNTISNLQQELLQSKSETQKVTDQLNCLITLIKRAWVGDNAAAIHVANIVGVAPPDYHEDDSKQQVTAIPKSRALNNWAVLAIGLLNKEYKRLEQIAQNRQRRYLHNRQAYLDEQLIFTRNLQATEIFLPYQHPLPPPVQSEADMFRQDVANVPEKHPQNSRRISSAPPQRVKSATTRKLGRPLYRDPPQSPSANATDLTWAHLVQHPSGSDNVFQGLSKLKSTSVSSVNQDNQTEKYSREVRQNYADPMKYHVFGLFDSETAVPASTTTSVKKRPNSGIKQRSSDAVRSRPKSSVLPKTERPMKYETTRPVSAQVASRRPRSGQTINRPTNGIAKDKVFLTLASDEGDNKEVFDTDETESAGVETISEETTEKLEINPDKPCIDVKIKRPQHVDAFVNDLKTMEQMEDDFKVQLDALQKKLGIANGII